MCVRVQRITPSPATRARRLETARTSGKSFKLENERDTCKNVNNGTAGRRLLRRYERVKKKKKRGKPSKCRRRTCRRTIRVGGQLETVTFGNDSDRFLRFSHYRSPAVREYSDTRLVQSFRRLVQRPGLLAACVVFVFRVFCRNNNTAHVQVSGATDRRQNKRSSSSLLYARNRQYGHQCQ